VKIMLVGVSCVGTTTIGGHLAALLGCPFHDLDHEVEKDFGTSIERLLNRHLTGYSFRVEEARVLEMLAARSADFVIALPPSGQRDAFLRANRRIGATVVAIEDTAENILERIRFYDIDSKPIEKRLTPPERKHYLAEISKDIAWFGRTYRRAHLHVDIRGLAPPAAAAKVRDALAAWREEFL
jgi:shikimate kinase